MENRGSVEIRAADAGDAAAIRDCLRDAFAAYRSAYTPGAFADTVPTVEQIGVRIQQMRVVVATAAGVVVGTVSGSVDGEHGHLRGMAVLPAWRGTGTAGKLLAAIEDWLRSCGCGEVTLDTTEPLTTAIAFYEKRGYRRSSRVSDFFGMRLMEYGKRL